jgi:hypothetical protein
MGLDASVLCTCLRTGRVRTPPFPPDLVVLDEDGWPQLDLPEGGTDEEYRRFRDWLRHCCEHPDMAVVNVRVANWGGLRSFEAALDRVGREHFSTVFTEVPHVNGGHTDPPAAARALTELAAFRRRTDVGQDVYLLDSETGHVIANHDATWDNDMFILGGGTGFDVGLDSRGMFVVSRTEPRREVFRAMRLEQRAGPAEELVELVDVDTGARFRLRRGVGGHAVADVGGDEQDDQSRHRTVYPRSMHVETRSQTPGDYEYILASLEAVFTASVETGNPVRWY